MSESCGMHPAEGLVVPPGSFPLPEQRRLREVQENPLPGVWGCPPIHFSSSPKMGAQGVETQRRERLDSRFRGNDKRGAGFMPNSQGTLKRPGTTHS